MDVMLKVITYLDRAYRPPQRFLIVYRQDWDASIPQGEGQLVYPFPQVCGRPPPSELKLTPLAVIGRMPHI
jgi:hypothetical protein